MIFRNFRVNTALRVIVASATFYLLLYLITDTDLYASMIVVALLFAYEIVSLIRYVELTNHKVTRFLQAIEYSDFSQIFRSERLGQSFHELDHAFAKVIERFQAARAEKEEQYRHWSQLVPPNHAPAWRHDNRAFGTVCLYPGCFAVLTFCYALCAMLYVVSLSLYN